MFSSESWADFFSERFLIKWLGRFSNFRGGPFYGSVEDLLVNISVEKWGIGCEETGGAGERHYLKEEEGL